MFIAITLLISTLFFQIILIQFITNQTLVKYKKLEINNNMKTESLKVLKEIYKIENSMTSLAQDNINSTIAILEKKCMYEYSKMNKCLIMDMQGKIITDNGMNTYCNAFLGFMDKINPNKKILKSDIKSLLMSYGGATTLGDGTIVSTNINTSPIEIKAYGGYVNYLNSGIYTNTEITNSLDNTTYTVDNFIKNTKIAKFTRLKQMLPSTTTTDYKNITFYSLFSVLYINPVKPIFFQDLKFPMYSNYKSKKDISFNNTAEFTYGTERYLHMVIPKLKNIYIILENLKRGQYKKLSIEISKNIFKPDEYNENENTYAIALIRFKNTIEALGYKDKPDLLFEAYERNPNTLATNVLAKAGTISAPINFNLLRYQLEYYNFNDVNYHVDYFTDVTVSPAVDKNINLCEFDKYIRPTIYTYN